jgi:hypothetical protein
METSPRALEYLWPWNEYPGLQWSSKYGDWASVGGTLARKRPRAHNDDGEGLSVQEEAQALILVDKGGFWTTKVFPQKRVTRLGLTTRLSVSTTLYLTQDIANLQGVNLQNALWRRIDEEGRAQNMDNEASTSASETCDDFWTLEPSANSANSESDEQLWVLAAEISLDTNCDQEIGKDRGLEGEALQEKIWEKVLEMRPSPHYTPEALCTIAITNT